jgi:hypothetical protein
MSCLTREKGAKPRSEVSASLVKSTDQTWLAATAARSGWRTVPRFRPRLRRRNAECLETDLG